MTSEEIRLKCLELVLKTGSAADAQQPFVRAERFYEWVMKEENLPNNLPEELPKKVGRPKKE